MRQPPFRPPEGGKPQAGVERAEELQGGVGPVDRHEAVGSVVDGIDGRVARAGEQAADKAKGTEGVGNAEALVWDNHK